MNDVRLRKLIENSMFCDTFEAFAQNRKIIAKRSYFTTLSNEQCQNLLRIKHENVVELFGVDKKFFFFEYSDCGSLHDYLHGERQPEYTVKEAINWMHQVAKGLAYMSSKFPNLMYHGLSSKSLIFFNNFRCLKICELLINLELPDCIPPNEYVSPEVVEDKKFITELWDVYSYGIILWEVMSRKKPFYHIKCNEWAPRVHVVSGGRPPVSDVNIPDFMNIVSLMERCWSEDIFLRPNKKELLSNMKDLINLLNSPTMKHVLATKIGVAPTVNFGNIKLHESLGDGSFGVVYRAFWCEKEFAVKKLYRSLNGADNKAMKDFEREVRQLSRVNHTNIVKLHAISFDKESAYLIMDYAKCGTLSNYLHGKEQRPFRMPDGIDLMIQCIMGIRYMHAMTPKPMIHRDLKPQNLLLTDEFRTLKIGDFGLATDKTTSMTEGCGTAAYIAPEVATGRKYSEKCDIYSFGIILWEVITRIKPFSSMLPLVIMNEAAFKGCRPSLNVDPLQNWMQLKSLIENCWDANPLNRRTASQIEYLLSNIRNCNMPIVS